MRFCLFGKFDEEFQMPVTCLFGFVYLKQFVTGVLANRLEQKITSLLALIIDNDQGLVHQLCQSIQHIYSRTNCFCSFEGPTTCKDGELPKQHLFFSRKQVITPVDQGTQGLMALKRCAASACQQLESIIKTRSNLFGRKDRNTRGC